MRHLISQKNGAAGQDNTGLNAQMRLGRSSFFVNTGRSRLQLRTGTHRLQFPFGIFVFAAIMCIILRITPLVRNGHVNIVVQQDSVTFA